ncbi:MAG: alpha-amylase family glycosyl hydrolase, partial [Bacteroidota bacterium]
MRRLFLVFALVFALPVLAQPAIERVEPAFWWAGMVHSELQVLVYGDDLAGARVTLDAYTGVTLRETVAVESPNYVFLTLDLAPDVQPGTLMFRFDHPGGALTHAYELRPRTRTPGTYAQGFNSEDVIYLMMPDRFANGDVANDSIPGLLEGVDRTDVNARQGGDMRGVIDNLDYLDDLGLTAIWFTPVFENDMTPEYGAYHGYAATDMYAIDPRFGTNDEFIELVDACHARGMKVIMDMIHNHVGDRHWWMADPPTSDWFNSWEEYGQTNSVGAA